FLTWNMNRSGMAKLLLPMKPHKRCKRSGQAATEKIWYSTNSTYEMGAGGDESMTLSGRDGFGKALLELGQENDKVVALCADLAESIRVHHFAEKYPERYFQIGIAEQDMIGTAAG